VSCPRCGGIGHICIDDMCIGSGECIHGDSDCPVCFGDMDYDDGPLYNDGQFYDAEDAADESQQIEADEAER
jgi:hypothetical protein